MGINNFERFTRAFPFDFRPPPTLQLILFVKNKIHMENQAVEQEKATPEFLVASYYLFGVFTFAYLVSHFLILPFGMILMAFSRWFLFAVFGISICVGGFFSTFIIERLSIIKNRNKITFFVAIISVLIFLIDPNYLIGPASAGLISGGSKFWLLHTNYGVSPYLISVIINLILLCTTARFFLKNTPTKSLPTK